MAKCPGQDQRFWKPKDIFEINCPDCSTSIEFWKDDPQVKCPGCKKLITNPKLDISCAKWCKYAKECLGVSSVNADSILCNTLIEDMKHLCQGDQHRINIAANTLKYAEQILSQEAANPLVVKAAAILCGADMQSSPDKAHEAVLARDVLEKHGIDAALVEQVSLIITACRDEKEIDSIEFKIVSDARQLTRFPEQFAPISTEKADQTINELFKTQHAKNIAKGLFDTNIITK
jgi:hypothetical protein